MTKSTRAQIISADELGQVSAEFNRMAQAIQDAMANEQAASSLLRFKVDALLGVVSKAAKGDLTGQIDVAGKDAIGQLAEALAACLRVSVHCSPTSSPQAFK
ncbi:HAMP domain-containing protein [Pseudoduganella sp. UC29_106]|uniref:HAMP domain-containing protein n=1 Tax=Pseudoduganella sp. UC29_106 TaxID=3374553 RepID=UPI00375729AA